MNAAELSVVVLASVPRPGSARTGLASRFGSQGAADLAAAALADTLSAVAAARVSRRVVVSDGNRLPFPLPPGFTVLPDVVGSHCLRAAAALSAQRGPALLIGMNTPQLTADQLTLDLSDPGVDAWLGQSPDGGWWGLGLRDPRRWSRRICAALDGEGPGDGTGRRQRLAEAGLRVAELPELPTVEDAEPALAVAAGARQTRFARLVHKLLAA